MSVTLKNIAEYTNLSISTVSRVFNSEPYVKEETRLAVLKAAKELNYKPNIPKSFRIDSGHFTRRIGVYFGGNLTRLSYDPFYLGILEAIADKCREQDYETVYISHNGNHNNADTYSMIQSKTIDALIVMFCENELIKLLKRLDMPLVSIQEYAYDNDLPSVIIDNFGGAREATEYLIKLGHKNIGFISGLKGRLEEISFKERMAGYRFALENNGIEFDSRYVKKHNMHLEPPGIKAGYECMKKVFEENLNLSAVFTANDLLAFGAIQAIDEQNLKMPEDISIIGFDNLPSTNHVLPPLTTVDVPRKEMGKIAVEKVVEQLENNSFKHRVTRVSTGLIVRKSCKQI